MQSLIDDHCECEFSKEEKEKIKNMHPKKTFNNECTEVKWNYKNALEIFPKMK